VVLFLSIIGLWLMRRGRLPGSRWFYGLAVFGLFAPILANSFGWIFTEMGRQPWTVFGVFTTPASVSPEVSGGEVLTSMVVFTLLYGVLAVIEVALMVKYVKLGPPAEQEVDSNPYDPDAPADRPLTFAY
jgi:cytochrome d ubiquinol oxidase subunit I